MWHLLKAELSYRKHIFYFSYGALALMFLIIWLWEDAILSLPRAGSVQSLAENFPKSIGALALASLNQPTDRQNDRLYVRSPISLKQIATVRLAPGVIFLVGLGIFFYLNFSVFQFPFTYPLKHQLWLAGLLLSLNAALLVANDLNRMNPSARGPDALPVGVITILYVASLWMRKFYLQVFDFPGGEFVLFTLFLSTYFLSLYLFLHRKSYLT